MLKKYSTLIAGLLMSTVALFGKEASEAETDLYSGGFVTGFGLTTLGELRSFGGNATGILQFGYYGPYWMVDIGANAGSVTESDVSVFVLGHLGGRCRLYQNLFISYGAMGLKHFVSKKVHECAWSVGAFAGLDYQLSKHFLLSGKVYPYNYDHRQRHRPTHSIFANTTLSLFYVF